MSLGENLAFLFSLLFIVRLFNQCNAGNPCIYEEKSRGKIDLSSVGHTDGTPRWKNVNPIQSDGHVYSYNPCHPFNQGNCRDAAGCQQYATDDRLTYLLGRQDSTNWIPSSQGSDPPQIMYSSGERTMRVNLRCVSSESDSLEISGYDFATEIYTMTLSSKCVCWNKCQSQPGPSPGPGSGGLSGGSLFLIILLVLAFIYVLGFVIFNRFKREATGLDLLPHRSFWVSLGGYALDGNKFLFRKITGKE